MLRRPVSKILRVEADGLLQQVDLGTCLKSKRVYIFFFLLQEYVAKNDVDEDTPHGNIFYLKILY
jgi:hypothetical protein